MVKSKEELANKWAVKLSKDWLDLAELSDRYGNDFAADNIYEAAKKLREAHQIMLDVAMGKVK